MAIESTLSGQGTGWYPAFGSLRSLVLFDYLAFRTRFTTRGTVVTAPIVSSNQPTLFRRGRFNRSASINPSPAPNAARVPAMKPSSGIPNETCRINPPFDSPMRWISRVSSSLNHCSTCPMVAHLGMSTRSYTESCRFIFFDSSGQRGELRSIGPQGFGRRSIVTICSCRSMAFSVHSTACSISPHRRW